MEGRHGGGQRGRPDGMYRQVTPASIASFRLLRWAAGGVQQQNITRDAHYQSRGPRACGPVQAKDGTRVCVQTMYCGMGRGISSSRPSARPGLSAIVQCPEGSNCTRHRATHTRNHHNQRFSVHQHHEGINKHGARPLGTAAHPDSWEAAPSPPARLPMLRCAPSALWC